VEIMWVHNGFGSSATILAGAIVIHKVLSGYFPMAVYSCKKCSEPNFLTPHAFWNISDFGAKCERCETINTITLENGELKNQI
jgi:hypothetical protein